MENPWNKRRFLAGKIIYKCTIFHGYVSHNQRVTAKKKNRRSPGWKVPRSSCETLRAPPRAVPLWHSAWDLSTSPATTCWGQTIILDLVVFNHLEKIWKSMGRMTSHIWKNRGVPGQLYQDSVQLVHILLQFHELVYGTYNCLVFMGVFPESVWAQGSSNSGGL